MDDYKIIVEQENQTVMAHYEVEPKPAEGYQSEAALEQEFIRMLGEQGYTYLPIHTEADLVNNLRCGYSHNILSLNSADAYLYLHIPFSSYLI